MTVSRPSLRIRRGRWRTRALAASPTAAERTARCSTGVREGAEELVRDGPQLLFALLRFLCRPGRWSTRLKLQRPPEGSAQVDGNVAKIDLAARGVDGALVHFNAPSWAVRAVMSSTTLPVCPKTRLNLPQPHSPSLPTHCTAPGNRECAGINSWPHRCSSRSFEVALTHLPGFARTEVGFSLGLTDTLRSGHGREIPGRGWIRNSRIPSEKRRSGRPRIQHIRTWLDGPECDS